MSETATVELDAQYRQLREECGLLDRSGRGSCSSPGPTAAEYLQGQLTNDVEALEPGRGPVRGAAGPQGAYAGRHAGAAAWPRTESGSTPSRRRLAAARRHLEMYKIGREVEVADAGAERAILSLIGPARSRSPAPPPLPENACEAATVGGVECIAVGTAAGIDLIAPAADAGRLRDALLAAGAVEVAPEAAEILRIEAGAAALRSRDGDRDDARRGRHRRGRGQLHQGLLHRPGDGRPPPLQGPPEPPPAGAAPERRGRARRRRCDWARRRSAGSAAPPSPPPSDRSGWRSCGARRSRAPSSP